jgi:hypothetical protein
VRNNYLAGNARAPIPGAGFIHFLCCVQFGWLSIL